MASASPIKFSREQVRIYADEQTEKIFAENFGPLCDVNSRIKKEFGCALIDMDTSKDDVYYRLLKAMKENGTLAEEDERPVRARPIVSEAITECNYTFPEEESTPLEIEEVHDSN